jgi:hypothetical protein
MSGTKTRARRTVSCAKCAARITWPGSLSTADKSMIAAEIRRSPLAGHTLLVDQFGFTNEQAKALMPHLMRASGVCHRCRHPLSLLTEVMTCKNCRSTNLAW